MNQKPNHALVFWVIWIAIFLSLFTYQFILGGGIPRGENQGNPEIGFQALSVGVVLAATFIRWFLIPKAQDVQRMLVLMIAGLALAEAAQFFQIFLIGPNYPETQMSIFILSLVGVGQFAPIYLKTKG